MKKYIILVVTCLFIGFISGRQTVSIKEKEVTKYVQGGTIRDTIAQLVPDTVYLAGELKYKYVYKTDTIYNDVPVIDREESIAETVRDWNRTREYNKLLFDDDNGKLSIALTPIHKEITIVKKRVFVPFVSASFYTHNSFSIGGGFFYHDIGLRAEWTTRELNFGVMYKF